MTKSVFPESNTVKISFDFAILGPSMLHSITFIFKLQIFKRASEANNVKDLFPKMPFPSFIFISETRTLSLASLVRDYGAVCHLPPSSHILLVTCLNTRSQQFDFCSFFVLICDMSLNKSKL